MESVTMPDSGRVDTFSIVGDVEGTVENLVFPISIDVADGKLVIAHVLPVFKAGSCDGGFRIGASIEAPPLRKLAILPIPSYHDGARVIATTHKKAWVLAVEVGDARQEPIDAIAIVV